MVEEFGKCMVSFFECVDVDGDGVVIYVEMFVVIEVEVELVEGE